MNVLQGVSAQRFVYDHRVREYGCMSSPAEPVEPRDCHIGELQDRHRVSERRAVLVENEVDEPQGEEAPDHVGVGVASALRARRLRGGLVIRLERGVNARERMEIVQ